MTNSRRSVLFGLLGLLSILGYNLWVIYVYLDRDGSGYTFVTRINVLTVLAVIFAAASVFYGIKARKLGERRALLGIALVIAIIFIFLVPIWPYFVSGQ